MTLHVSWRRSGRWISSSGLSACLCPQSLSVEPFYWGKNRKNGGERGHVNTPNMLPAIQGYFLALCKWNPENQIDHQRVSKMFRSYFDCSSCIISIIVIIMVTIFLGVSCCHFRWSHTILREWCPWGEFLDMPRASLAAAVPVCQRTLLSKRVLCLFRMGCFSVFFFFFILFMRACLLYPMMAQNSLHKGGWAWVSGPLALPLCLLSAGMMGVWHHAHFQKSCTDLSFNQSFLKCYLPTVCVLHHYIYSEMGAHCI